MAFVLDAACGSNIGNVRKNNEDNCYFNGETLPENNSGIQIPWRQHIRDETVCFGVFDGMGGEEDGQVASFLAAQSFASDCRRIGREDVVSESFFNRAVSSMNQAVYLEAERRKNNMGTTAVLMGFCNNTVSICNVGDSRAYRFRDGRLTQLSVDHVEALPPCFEGERHKKAKLGQCIGMSPEELKLEPFFVQDVLCPGDQFLLCSDGLTDMVSADTVQMILSKAGNAALAVQRLIECALANGGKDNITVLLIRNR